MKPIPIPLWSLPLVLALVSCSGAATGSDGGGADAGPDERLTSYQCLISADCPRRMVAAHRRGQTRMFSIASTANPARSRNGWRSALF